MILLVCERKHPVEKKITIIKTTEQKRAISHFNNIYLKIFINNDIYIYICLDWLM